MGRDSLMKFSLISDMHINHPQLKTPYDDLEQVVVVAGDTDNGLGGLKFLQKLRNKGFQVLATDGNHEHYSNASQGRSVIETTARFREECPDLENIDGIYFILRNGWYRVENEPHWFNYMNDSRYSGASAEVVNQLAKEDALFIRDTLTWIKEKKQKAVVVTHTSPCVETLDPRFEGDYSNIYYHNPLMTPLLEEFQDTILAWCHGHTHAFQDKIVNGTRVVCNPRGYPRENPDWKPFTIEV